MRILGIESSCDETAAAVVRDGTHTLSDVVRSQVEVHSDYGGVVPELASRLHIEAVSQVIEKAIVDAGISFSQIEGIGVTRGPGLIGSLLVGIGAAKGLALALDVPICGVNHVHGHLFALGLERAMPYPFVGLVVSGGHTTLFHVRDPFDIQRIGKTRDDAAGEAFDKIAKLLGLGYPGGPAIEKCAAGVDPGDIKLPIALREPGNLDFSFSGLKTAALRQVEHFTGRAYNHQRLGSFHPMTECDEPESIDWVRRLAASFQRAVTESLSQKTLAAAKICGVKSVVVCGGVAANRALRTRLEENAQGSDVEVHFPSIPLCTDNAAMIAARAETLLNAGFSDSLDFDAKSRW